VEKPTYDVFLSYSDKDRELIEDLAARLKRRKINPWLYKHELIGGRLWKGEVQEALGTCQACAICIGAQGLTKWQREEADAAITRQVNEETGQVFLVFLPGSEQVDRNKLPVFLKERTYFEFHGTLDNPEVLRDIVTSIRGDRPRSGRRGKSKASTDCPYRGLKYFDVKDWNLFYGRETLIDGLLAKWAPLSSDNRFLAIIGPSGSGKSSLARAGLLGLLERKPNLFPGSEHWPPRVIFKPGRHPLETLVSILRPGDPTEESSALVDLFSTNPRTLHRTAMGRASEGQRFVVLVDQFEEIFTLCKSEALRQAFIENVLTAVTEVEGRTAIVITLRSDFIGHCLAYRQLADALNARSAFLAPMTKEELRRCIEKPAEAAHLTLEGGLSDLLIGEVLGQAGGLPLLGHALDQIWHERKGALLTVSSYRDIGGVAGALERHAETIFSQFTVAEKEACRRVLLQLVQVDEQRGATKRRCDRSELISSSDTEDDGQAESAVVSKLTRERLLTTEAVGEEKRPMVELAHEALLNNWSLFKEWIEQDREALRTRRRLDEAVAEWIGNNRDSSFLYRGARLAQAEEWKDRHPGELNQDARAFLATSVAERDRERRRLRNWAIASTAAAVVAIAAATTALYLRHIAVQQRSVAEAENLAATSLRQSQRDPVLGLLLSIKAVRLADFGGQPHLPSAEEALRNNLSVFRGSPLPTGKVRTAALSADRRWLTVAGSDGAISVWDLGDGGPPKRLSLKENSARSTEQIAVSTGGKWLLIADTDDSHLLQLNAKGTAESDFPLKGEDWLFGSDPFSLDGRWLVTRKDDAFLLRPLTAPPRIVATFKIQPEALAFSPDGRWLAMLESNSLALWDLAIPNPNPRFRVPGGGKSLTFSSDSQWVVAAEPGRDGAVQAWKISPSAGLGMPVRFGLDSCAWSESAAPSALDSLLFSRIPNFARCYMQVVTGGAKVRLNSPLFTAATIDSQNKSFAAGSSAGSISIGSLSPSSISPWTGALQAGPVWLLSFQGSKLISQGGGDPPRVFEVLSGPDVAGIEPLRFPRAPGTVAVSPQGWRLSVDPASHKATLWGPRGPQLVAAAEQASQPWIFSPDGHFLAAAGVDGRPRAWRINGNDLTSSPVSFSTQYHHATPATVLAFSPDQRWIASGDQNGEARLWSLQNPNAEPLPLTNSEGGVAALAFRSDGRVIATAARNVAVRLRDLNDDGLAPADRPEFPGDRLGIQGRIPGGAVTALTFLKDGRLALAGSRDRVKLWRSNRQESFLNSGGSLVMLAANPQGNRLAGQSASGSVQIWSLESKDPFPDPVRLPESFQSFAFTPDGNGLWTVGKDGRLQRWELRTDKLLETACRAAGRNLTEQREWREYIPSSEPYEKNEPCPEFPKAFD
jgi:WD40 repeat protein